MDSNMKMQGKGSKQDIIKFIAICKTGGNPERNPCTGLF